MKIGFIKPYKTNWELDILPNILVLRIGNEIRLAISILLWGIVFHFKIK